MFYPLNLSRFFISLAARGSECDLSFLSGRVLIFAAVFSCIAAFPSDESWAYTSDDPAVLALTEKGLDSLNKNVNAKTHYEVNIFHSGGAGEKALAAYAYMKLRHDPSSPVVQQGLRSALFIANSPLSSDPGGEHSKTVYAAAVATLLLAEVDSIKYRTQLKKLDQYFRKAQYSNGAYGYPGQRTGDVSQTQYAILALWTLDNAGIIIDYKGVAATIKWLLRVQDPSGGWPYQATDPGSGSRITQQNVYLGMALAGGSAVLIAADILQLWEKEEKRAAFPGLPKAVIRYEEGMENLAVPRPEMPVEPILASIKDCDNYIAKHSNDKVNWPYYNIYTIERYNSFREKALGLEANMLAPWYDTGVNYLKSNQANDGGWNGTNQYVTKSTAASFAILFLSRSTQKAIEQAATQSLAGGRELPKDTTKITVEKGKIKGKPVAQELGNLLQMLEQDGANNIEGKSIPDNLKLAEDPRERATQLDRMERLVRGSRSWQARRVACRLLGQSDDLGVVPTLIYALSDPDPMVPRYARDGLRFISRKFEGYGLSDSPNAGEIANAQKKWRAWYRTMDPGYVFLDFDL
ncbi:hypothetical protein Q31b_26200 [Novipirellula aureliae]|uniref:Prenyltransferase and squalene oxidase repeat protein n=2 Tax=Novipirellula aureliae TaxID=2527966 RepID=A0A5C6E0K5_9BACT|nr:hypothetical protein Q31b_26200 [Novipirellula aureliae]